MKLILFLPVVGFAAAGILNSAAPRMASVSSLSTAETPSPRPSTGWARPMWTEAHTVRRDETITLHFALPHPDYLGVIDPDGHFYYLVFPAALGAGNLKPLVSTEQFRQMASLSLSPARLTADPFTYGVLENRPVFTKKGRYTFIIGDNLHVHDPDGLTSVAIDWQN